MPGKTGSVCFAPCGELPGVRLCDQISHQRIKLDPCGVCTGAVIFKHQGQKDPQVLPVFCLIFLKEVLHPRDQRPGPGLVTAHITVEQTGFIGKDIIRIGIGFRTCRRDRLETAVDETAHGTLIHDIDIFPEGAGVVGPLRSVVSIFFAEDEQHFKGIQFTGQGILLKGDGAHLFVDRRSFMQLAVHIQRTFRRPDDPVGLVIDPELDGAGFVVGDAPLHVKSLCGKFGMPFQHQTASLTAGITGFVIDPVG